MRRLGHRKIKVGHAGTLDPLATGVLIVCLGRATKQAEALQAQPKEYLTTLALGATTPSFDMEHPVDRTFPYEHITRQMLEEALRAQHILNLNACIGYPQNEDEYLTKDSEKFHQKLGYRLVGTFHDSGYKFGRWYDMIWMEKMLGEHTESPASVIPFSETEWAASHR